MTKNIFAILCICLLSFSAFAQEIITTPAFNPAVSDSYKNRKPFKTATDTIRLPFYDDFSVISVTPSPLRWADAFTFVNTDYAKFSPSIGVVTLDALDDKGALYPDAGPNAFDADNLTSLPIRLDSLFSPTKKAVTVSDSIYLSFYYQPQGRTVSPPSKDASLLLEFHAPGEYDTIPSATDTVITPRWSTVWFTEGGTKVDTFAKQEGSYFKHVLIPILDSARYFKSGFQFRFRNIAALMGNSQPDWRNNGSHWNIDVVWLNAGKTVQKDMAFAAPAPSMLRNYQSMPFSQYKKNFINEVKDTLDIAISNLYDKNQNVSYKYDVRKNSLNTFKTYDGGSYTISPFETDGYTTYAPFAKPPVNFLFPISDDEKIVFHIIHMLTPDPNPLFRSNDSIQFDQLFSNYYAYDNGTAESGIGINGDGSYAVQFKLNEADTLLGMQIYFNPVINGANLKLIDLHVWNDSHGKPGTILDTLGIMPSYSGNLNEFNSYWFETPKRIDATTFPGLIFYIGWTQSFVDNVNIGFDRYNNSQEKRFYNVDGNWEMSSDANNYGSVMMRPIIGSANPLKIEKPLAAEQLRIMPNPVTDGNFSIKLPQQWNDISENTLEVRIVSATGSLVYSGGFSNTVNVSGFKPGFYMVLLTDTHTGRKASAKLVIR
jgi:hypothetical protein